MNLASFLHASQTPSFWHQNKSIVFIGDAYPALFFRQLLKILENGSNISKPHQRIFIDAIDMKTLSAQLQQTILGDFSFFWFGNVTEEKESKKTLELINFLLNYKGPHQIAFFVNSASSISIKEHSNVVTIQEAITLGDADALSVFLRLSLDEKKQSLIKKIIHLHTSFSLESYCLLIQYLELINTKQLNEYVPFLESLVGANPTLNLLSDSFFAKNAALFFETWSTIGKNYPDIFWLAFWSELLWKASHTLTFLKNNDFVAIKRMSYRLPFQFAKKYWQHSSHDELIAAFNFLYQIDYGIKTGSDFCAFDLFFMNYFTGYFSNGALLS